MTRQEVAHQGQTHNPRGGTMLHTTAAVTARGTLEVRDGELVVRATWEGGDLDRRDARAWLVGADTPAKRKLAGRLLRAINDQVAVTPGDAYTDVSGARGIHGRSPILGRMMNADLHRLGY